MQARRNAMKRSVAKRYARVPGEPGDAAAPTFYPIAINPGWWGQPLARSRTQATS